MSMRRQLLLALVLVATAGATAEAEPGPAYSYKALDVLMTGADCPSRVPKLLRLAQAAEAAGKNDQAGDIYAGIASCYGQMGQTSAGARYLTRAVSLGMDNCPFLVSDAGLKRLPNHAATLKRVKMSPADAREVMWSLQEVAAINHDTSMMIRANMIRKDGGATVTFPPALPTRKHKSPSVGLHRWALVYMFNNQRSMVMRSDQARIKHLASISIIGNMGTGSNAHAKQRQRNLSRLTASQAATKRKLATAARAFRSSRASTRKVSCNRL